jgi:hypothetical protein
MSAAGSPDLLLPDNPGFQIFGFVLCESFGSSPETTVENVRSLDAAASALSLPDLVVSATQGVIVRAKYDRKSV